ncbi:MAG: hypothetical protein GY941_13335 [Planctomycetes bacterium]|nr:hypothetical protein [Planctomycetota bacterium]
MNRRKSELWEFPLKTGNRKLLTVNGYSYLITACLRQDSFMQGLWMIAGFYSTHSLEAGIDNPRSE